MIAFEIASKNVKAPEFLVSFALQLAKKNCSKLKDNPFSIELSEVDGCLVPALFVYCLEDNIISCQNTHMIASKYGGVHEKLMIEENHNTVRSMTTIKKIFGYVDKYLRKGGWLEQKTSSVENIYYHRGDKTPAQHPRYHLNSHQHSREHSRDSPSLSVKGRKGIERVEQMKVKRHDDYGIWVASK